MPVDAPTAALSIRVAFVDDDAAVLQALKNVLRRYRREWSMAFFSDPRQALEVLVADPVDVVVVDSRMPRLGGEAFLKEVRTRAPATARVILSGQADLSEATRLLGLAHQYLSKPCEPAHLAEVVNRVARVRKALSSAALMTLFTATGRLPIAPRVWTELTRVLSSDRAQIADVVKVIEQEPVLAAKVLQLSNSAYFGMTREVLALPRAVMVLGFEVLRAMVLVFETEKVFPAAGVDLEQMRARSLLAARVVRSLLSPGPVADAAATATLIADLGAMLLAARVPDAFLPLWESHAPHETEEASLGVSHGLVGAWLLSLWGLPSAVVDMVAMHHVAPVDQPASAPGVSVWLALALAEAWEGSPDDPVPSEVERYVAEHSLSEAVERARAIARLGAKPEPAPPPH
jgi:HD-like signal output (HDOD) protein/CheY-like chemotaxis protein